MGRAVATEELRHLGKVSNDSVTELDTLKWEPTSRAKIVLRVGEFTSECPVTGQPDYASLYIEYIPTDRLVETKSLKLYLQSFRDRGMFNEAIIDEIADKFAHDVGAQYVFVRGEFRPRGGIGVTVEIERGTDR